MTKNCIVPFCRHRGKIPGIKYYQITSRRRKSWLKALGRNPDDKISAYSFVCSIHFPQEQIDAEGCISPFTVPSLNLRPPKIEKEIAMGSIPKNSKWLSAIERDENLFIGQQTICSEHFKEDDFEHNGLHKTFKANVISTLPEIASSEHTFKFRDLDSITEPEESEIITIEMESSTPEDIYDTSLPEDIEERMSSSPLVPASSSDSNEEPRSINSTPVSDASSPPLPEENDVFLNTSSANSTIDSLNINPLHYLKRLKKEQERLNYFKSKYKSAVRTGNRRKKKILYLKTVLDDVKKKLKQSTDVS